MSRRTVMIVCAKAPRRIDGVPAVLYHLFPGDYVRATGGTITCPVDREIDVWLCSWCGKRVKVVA